MNTQLAYKTGRKVGLAKLAAVLRPHKATLVKLAKTLNALERKGKITKAAADRAFDKTAGIMLPALAAYGAYKAAPAIGRGLKSMWSGLTGGGAKPGASATAAPGSAGAAEPAGGTSEVTDPAIAKNMQRYTGMSPAAMSNFNAARVGMVGRSAPYQAMAGTIRGAFGAM